MKTITSLKESAFEWSRGREAHQTHSCLSKKTLKNLLFLHNQQNWGTETNDKSTFDISNSQKENDSFYKLCSTLKHPDYNFTKYIITKANKSLYIQNTTLDLLVS